MDARFEKVTPISPARLRSRFASSHQSHSVAQPSDGCGPWWVDTQAIAVCRELFARGSVADTAQSGRSGGTSLLDVPAAYENFCRAHFTAVKRLHPELSWDDVSQVYAIALLAHAQLCVELTEERERQLEQHWSRIRGHSLLSWAQARPLLADGCRALARLDPITCSR
jgi:hypothetical protein